MKEYILVAVFCLSAIQVLSQDPDPAVDDWICGNSFDPPFIENEDRASNCSNTSLTYLNYYWTPGFWAPDANNNTPIKTIRINFVVFQKDDGTGTMSDNPVSLAGFQRLIDSLNYT